MEFQRIFKGRALYIENDQIWVARGMRFWAIDSEGKRISRKHSVGSIKQKIFSWHRLIRQLLREGIHHLLLLENGNFLVSVKRKIYILNQSGEVLSTFAGYRGNKPGHQGMCVTPDGTIFLGEYTLNTKREHDTRLFRSIDNGMSFECISTFPHDTIRHIHFIKYDSYENCIWLGTGDEDFECKLLRSFDYGSSWQVIGEGSQNWRAIGVCFTPDYLVWGTDAGSVPDQNHIIRMDRANHELEILANVEGPCHGCASLTNGQILISTGVEGGENEKDRFARLKMIDGEKLIEIYKMKKDILPLIVQYGVIRFPLGTDNTDRLVFTSMGLKNGVENVFLGENE